METAYNCPWLPRGWSAHLESRRPMFSALLSLRRFKDIPCPLQESPPATGLHTSMETGHSLPLLSKQNDRTEKKQASEGQWEREQARKHLSLCCPLMWAFCWRKEALAPVCFQKSLHIFILSFTGLRIRWGEGTTALVILWNTEVFSLNLLDNYWHLLTLNCERSLSAIYFHPAVRIINMNRPLLEK